MAKRKGPDGLLTGFGAAGVLLGVYAAVNGAWLGGLLIGGAGAVILGWAWRSRRGTR